MAPAQSRPRAVPARIIQHETSGRSWYAGVRPGSGGYRHDRSLQGRATDSLLLVLTPIQASLKILDRQNSGNEDGADP